MAGVALALIVGLLGAERAQAQMKIAILNVGEVFQKYEKAKFYKDELDKVIAPKKVEAETLKKQMLDWKKAMESKDFKKEDSDRYTAAIRDNQRKLEDLDRSVRTHIGKIQESQIVTLFRDLCAGVEGVAKSSGVHMVLAYGDVTEDQFNVFNINRKMNGMDLGGTVPLYFTPDVNITQQVVDALNAHYRGAGGGTAGTPVSRPK